MNAQLAAGQLDRADIRQVARACISAFDLLGVAAPYSTRMGSAKRRAASTKSERLAIRSSIPVTKRIHACRAPVARTTVNF